MGIYSFFKQKKFFKSPQEIFLFKILGFYPKNTELYKEALTHRSIRSRTKHNERLEFLGDAIFGSVVSELVYIEFPKESEGFLTQTKAKIVSRKTLNKIALKNNLDSILKHQVNSNPSIFGNALEALIGAIFLEKGYQFTSNYIKKKLIKPNLDIHLIAKEISSYKSKLLEWGQAKKKEVSFTLLSSHGKDHEKFYKVMVIVNSKNYAEAEGTSIKKAEELAAKKAYKELIVS